MEKEHARRCNDSLQLRAAALKAIVAAASVLVAVAAAEPEQCAGGGEPASLIG